MNNLVHKYLAKSCTNIILRNPKMPTMTVVTFAICISLFVRYQLVMQISNVAHYIDSFNNTSLTMEFSIYKYKYGQCFVVMKYQLVSRLLGNMWSITG